MESEKDRLQEQRELREKLLRQEDSDSRKSNSELYLWPGIYPIEDENKDKSKAIQSEEERQRKLEIQRKIEKRREPSLQGFLLAIAYYGGIALAIIAILGLISEFSPTPDVDRLPPSWNP